MREVGPNRLKFRILFNLVLAIVWLVFFLKEMERKQKCAQIAIAQRFFYENFIFKPQTLFPSCLPLPCALLASYHMGRERESARKENVKFLWKLSKIRPFRV